MRARSEPFDGGSVAPWRPHRRPFLVASGWVFWAIVALNAAIIVWLWLQGGGISAVHSSGELWTSIGRITGLISAYLALLQVLLLARLPVLERLAGFDRLTVWHRLNGKACLILVIAHVVFITIGYAAMDRLPIPAEAQDLLQLYPGMVAATFGTALMIVVVVTSLVILRSRLRYEAWYAVHITAYAAIALAWLHQIPTGNEFAVNATAANYWRSLYVVTLVLLVGFRLLQPIYRALRYRIRVEEVIEEGPNVVSLRMSGRHLDRLGARAGQFFLWRFLSWNRFWEAHPFSLSAAPDGRSLRITAKTMGDFTAHMGSIRPGTPVIAEGPFGVFTDAVQRREKVLLTAGGIGITPIRALAEEMQGDLVILYRVVREEDVVFRSELDRLALIRGFTVQYIVGDHADPEGARLLSPDHLRELVPDIERRDVYVCGPPAMADAIERNVRRAGVAPRHIHIERFAL